MVNQRLCPPLGKRAAGPQAGCVPGTPRENAGEGGSQYVDKFTNQIIAGKEKTENAESKY
jgi:hypothetical protein